MAENQERRQDPLFEFIVLGALVLGAVFEAGLKALKTLKINGLLVFR